MLRKTVVLLLLLNLVWWVWAKDWLAPLGLPATFTGEPERLARQIHPEALRVQPLPPGTPIIKTVSAHSEPPAMPRAAPSAAPVPTSTPAVNAGKKHQGG